MSAFLQGCLLGLTFAILIGPAFFALIQTSIHRGFRSGGLFAVGIFLSDLFALVLIYFGASRLLGDDPKENIYFSIIGGIIIIIFGTYTFTRREAKSETDDLQANNKLTKPYIYILKGFLMNTLNPGVWFLWMTIVVSLTANYGANNLSVVYFLSGALATIFSTDILKCFISQQIKRLLNAKVMTWMNRIVGIILILFGAFLIIRVFVDLETMIQFYESLRNN